MRLLTPTTLDEALALMAIPDQTVTPIAGGTDLMVSWHHLDKDDLCLMDLSHLQQLRTMQLTDDYLELGALVTYWQIITSREVSEAFPLLRHAAGEVGAVQIQTRATWAGNIANGSPAADGVTVMMVYDATVLLQGLDGIAEVPLNQYYTGYKQSVCRPDQLIVGIRLPRRKRELEWWHKVGSRSPQAIAKVAVALVRDTAGWRVVANSVAPYVCRCRNLEQELNAGTAFKSPDEIKQCLQADISPIDDIRSTAHYRETVLSRLLYYKLLEVEMVRPADPTVSN